MRDVSNHRRYGVGLFLRVTDTQLAPDGVEPVGGFLRGGVFLLLPRLGLIEAEQRQISHP
jgi:hypothetical protein